jgi:2-polyprenyl-6-methoxyphenol hydroxylase-like FAD-dependent oxidoreductase
MTDILILGAGLTGLSTALLLSRDGHRVTVVDRDPPPPPPGREWDEWQRPGVTQFRQAHFMLPFWHAQMRADLPEVLDRLAAAGARRISFAALLPPPVFDGGRPGDDRFDTLTARRPVLEAAFAAEAAHLDVRRGTAVAGLIARAGRVAGVRLADGTAMSADLVVDCMGRRSPLRAWLVAAGFPAPAQERDDAGFVYYGRHFEGAMPAVNAPLLQHHDSVSILTLPADNDTWSVGFVASTRDHALRALRDPECWAAALACYPTAAHWADGKPLTGVDVMAGLADQWRTVTTPGVVAVGDSACCTNPSLGRGAGIGLLHARTLRDYLRAPDGDFAARTAAVIEPLYRATYWFDHHRIAEIDADVAGVPYRPADPAWFGARALYGAALHDPEAARVNLAAGLLLQPPPPPLSPPPPTAPGPPGPRYPLAGPDRNALLAALSPSKVVGAGSALFPTFPAPRFPTVGA